ncbi:IKI3 family-domain-containing protein [Obelidium mucronatum]|nr:IKI3 family-domain-containing protein [Obelidium mucronatum]
MMRSLLQTSVTHSQLGGLALSAPQLTVDSDLRRVAVVGTDLAGRVWVVDAGGAAPLFGDDSFAAPAVGAAHVDGALVALLGDGRLGVRAAGAAQCELVGAFDGGAAALQWAPDGELGAVAAAGRVHVVTAAFDAVGEAPLAAGGGRGGARQHAAKEARPDARNSLCVGDDLAPRISWRHDGKFFAVSFVDVAEQRRVVKIFTREGELHSVCEEIPNLQKTLAWRPQGNLIATVQTLPSSQLQIAFFETNGLRHGEFALRESDKDTLVEQLAWNADSTILAVFLKRRGETVVQLWTMGNYYYYLKQEIVHAEIDVILWDPEDALLLYISSEKATKLHKTSNMPPPMYETKIGPFEAAVNSAAVGEYDLVAVLLSNNSMALVKDINSDKPVTTSIQHEAPLGSLYRQITFHGPSTLMVIVSNSLDSTRGDCVVYFDIDVNSGKVLDSGKVDLPTSSGLFRLNGDLRSNTLIAEADDGAVYQIENVDGFWSAEFVTELPAHTARFIPLSGVEIEADSMPLDDLNIPATGAMVHDETLRRVERGSRIVAAVPGGYEVDSANASMETWRPFIPVHCLDYSKAFILCRKHRINMNLLVDHNPELFMANVDLFVKSVKDADYLNLFVNSLSETDVTTTMYIPSPPPPKRANPYFKPQEKVNTLCTTLRTALAPFDATTTYVTTVLTTFAKQTPQDLEGAMGKVKSMKAISLEETENALKYLIFLANANLLYNVALGMYDFQLVVMVAQYSQKDPREYLPFLTALKLLPQHRQYFKIDDHLSRYSSALSHLFDLIEALESNASTKEEAKVVFAEELIPYMVKNELFKDALARYEQDEEKWKQVVVAYGGFLFSKARFGESGLMFQMAGEKEKALLSYRSDYPLWKQALSIAQEMQLPEKEVLEIANELGETLMERHEHAAAATVYIEYCGDIVTGVRSLLKGSFWDEAVRVFLYRLKFLSACRLTSMVAETLCKPKSRREFFPEYETTLDDLKELLVTFQKQRARLETVRKDHLEKQANSSKSRRRNDRKRAAGREGGFYEEEFLVNSLFKAVEKTNSIRGAIYRLVTALMSHRLIKESRILQTTYASLIPALKAGCEGVFEKENIVTKGMDGKTVEEEKIAFMVKMGSLPASALVGSSSAAAAAAAAYASMGHNGSNKSQTGGAAVNVPITAEAEVERKRDPKYPEAPPVFSSDIYGLDVL